MSRVTLDIELECLNIFWPTVTVQIVLNWRNVSNQSSLLIKKGRTSDEYFTVRCKGFLDGIPAYFLGYYSVFLGKVVWYVITGREDDDDPFHFAVFQGVCLSAVFGIILDGIKHTPDDGMQKLDDFFLPFVVLGLSFFLTFLFTGLNFLLMKIGSRIRRLLWE